MLDIKFADPTSDIAFKKLFANHQHKEVLISFLNAILERKEGEKIVEVEILDPNNIALIQELQATILDVRCTDQSGNHYIIEMQKKNRYDFPERCVFYASYVYAQQLTNKKPYKELTPVIFVGIVDFNLFDGIKAISHHFICDSETQQRTLKHQEYHFVELPKFAKQEDELTSVADKWIYLLKHAGDFRIVPQSLRKPEEIETALQILSTHFWSQQELNTYFYQMDQYRLALSDAETARLAIEKALTDGKAEGKVEEKIETAKQMLQKGFDVALIQEITRLSKEAIQGIILTQKK